MNNDKTIERKLKEIVLGVRLESIYDKSSILEMYLNQMYFGHGSYGIAEASAIYFNKNLNQLNIEETATLIGLLQAPSSYDLINNEKKANQRKNQILKVLNDNYIIDKTELQNYQNHTISAIKKEDVLTKNTTYKYPYFTTWVIKNLEKKYGDKLYTDGMYITTTLDTKAQDYAIETAINKSKYLSKTYNMNDIAITTIDPQTGELKAMVGGANFEKNQINMAITPRQPGSSIKPFVYGAGFEYGILNGSTIILDEPVTYMDYEPRNYIDKHYGYITAREALYTSNNIAAIKTGILIGHKKIKTFIENLGVTSLDESDANISMPVGGLKYGISPYEMAIAYGVFANKGKKAEPYYIEKITDEYGEIISKTKQSTVQIIKEETANEITDILMDVVQKSTGRNAKIGRELAGKTGTTNSNRDWWFVGYTPNAVTAVWVGNSNFDKASKGGSSSSTAAVVFGDYMNKYKNLIDKENFNVNYDLVYKTFYLSKDETHLIDKSCKPPINIQTNNEDDAKFIIKELAVYPSYKPSHIDCPSVSIATNELAEFLKKDLTNNLKKVLNTNNKDLIIDTINLGYGEKIIELGYIEEIKLLNLENLLKEKNVIKQNTNTVKITNIIDGNIIIEKNNTNNNKPKINDLTIPDNNNILLNSELKFIENKTNDSSIEHVNIDELNIINEVDNISNKD